MAQASGATGATRALEGAKHIRLVTYRRSGEGVATTVWFALNGAHLYVETGPRTGKMKRIQHTPRVMLAPCTFGGKVTGPFTEGRARIVDDALERERAQALMARKYGLVRRLNYWMGDVLRVLQRRPTGQLVYLAITLLE